MNTKEKINSLICLTLLLQLTFYFTSCKTSEVQNNNQLIYKGKKEFGDVSDFMDALKPFVIETSDDIVIAPSFIRIIENDGIFYAVDRFRRNIIGFDINGLIKFRFESLGMGNLDYSRIADIAWNQDKDCLMLLDSNKILLIDKEANAFEAIQLDSFYDSFSYCNGNIYLTNTQSINGEHTPFSVSVINKNGEISQLLPSLFDYSPYCFTGGCNIVNIDNEIMYTRKFDDNIYNLSVSNEFDVWYNLDLKDLKFTPEKKTYECVELCDQCREEYKIFTLGDMQLGNDYLTMKSNLFGIIIVSLQSKEFRLFSYLYDFPEKTPLPNYIPIENSNSLVFFYMDSEYFRSFAEKSGSDYLKKLSNNLPEESNPVVLPYRLR